MVLMKAKDSGFGATTKISLITQLLGIRKTATPKTDLSQ
jgi:hypothetical protein